MSVVICPSCNTPAAPGAIFCDNCGYDLRNVEAAAPDVEAAVPAPVPPEVPSSPPAPEGIVCPNCQQVNVPDALFCENCGQKLSQPAPQSLPAPAAVEPVPARIAPAAVTPPIQDSVVPTPATPAAAPPVPLSGRVVVQSSKASLQFPPGKASFLIGREDPVSGVFPEIDLDPYGAQDEGVSRRHAQITLQGPQAFIQDLNTVNGTFVNRQKLTPGQSMQLNNGDEIRLGKLILIYYSS